MEAVTAETLIAGRNTRSKDARSSLDEAAAKALGPSKLSAASSKMLIRVTTQQLGNGQFADAERTLERVLSEHPLRLSNTALLHNCHGWSGINFDADQRYIDEFDIQRSNGVNICCGVGAPAMGIFADGAVNSFDPPG